MAAITKTTNTLNINFIDGAAAVTTWRLDNPKDNVTLAEVNTAIQDMWFADNNQGIFVNSAGNELVSLKSVEREQIVKTVEQIT